MKRGMSFARRPSGSSLDLLSNLILSLDLEEASGNAIDSSGNSYTFTDTNTVGQTTGATAGYNARVCVAASTEYFTRAHSNTELTIGDNEWAAHMWIYNNAMAASRPIFSKTGNASIVTTSSRSFILGQTATATDRALLWSVGYVTAASGAVTVTTPNNEFPSGSWTPILIWHDPSADVIGIKAGSNAAVTAAFAGGARNGTANVVIAALSGGSVPSDMSAAALRIWRGSGVIAQIVSNTDALAFLNAQQRRHSELT